MTEDKQEEFGGEKVVNISTPLSTAVSDSEVGPIPESTDMGSLSAPDFTKMISGAIGIRTTSATVGMRTTSDTTVMRPTSATKSMRSVRVSIGLRQ